VKNNPACPSTSMSLLWHIAAVGHRPVYVRSRGKRRSAVWRLLASAGHALIAGMRPRPAPPVGVPARSGDDRFRENRRGLLLPVPRFCSQSGPGARSTLGVRGSIADCCRARAGTTKQRQYRRYVPSSSAFTASSASGVSMSVSAAFPVSGTSTTASA
jgi:hypothetical protein